MSNEQWNDIWKILKSGQLKFVDNVNSDILCTICKKVLINAHGSPCGCRYCLECITTYLNGEDKICPGNTNLCDEEIININNVLLDHMMNRKISRLIVKCPQEKCKCQDELRNIENHMLICDFRSVDCPYVIMGCNYFDSDLKKHMLNEIVSHTKLIFEYIDNLKNEIKVLKEDKNDLKKYKNDIEKCVNDLQLECDRNDKEIKESKDLLKKSEKERKEDAIGMKQEIRMLNEEMETLKKETLENKEHVDIGGGLGVGIGGGVDVHKLYVDIGEGFSGGIGGGFDCKGGEKKDDKGKSSGFGASANIGINLPEIHLGFGGSKKKEFSLFGKKK